jgi:hypothetical protein
MSWVADFESSAAKHFFYIMDLVAAMDIWHGMAWLERKICMDDTMMT